MMRHMLVTLLIVVSVYVSLLVVINHPFVAYAQDVEQAATGLNTTDVAGDAEMVEESETDFEPAKVRARTKAADEPKPTNLPNNRNEATNVADVPMFHGPDIIGVSGMVVMANAELQVAMLWQELLDNKSIINKVKWRSDNIKVYAMYSDFDEAMTKARLTIGFDANVISSQDSFSKIALPKGRYDTYLFDSNTNQAVNKAWSKAHVHDNLIERHTLNSKGERVGADAIVVLMQRSI